MAYPNLEKILDRTWLKENPNHVYNQWIIKPDDSVEKMLLSRFDAYVQKVSQRNLQDKIKKQFVDTYNELEIGCSLIEMGFKVSFGKILSGERSDKTPDIFIEGENVIVEVKTLHRGEVVERGMKSFECFEFDEAKRAERELFIELEKYKEQEINYPLIVVVCKDVTKPSLVSSDDLETILYYQKNKMIIIGEHRAMSTKAECKGLYFDYGEQPRILSGVGLWFWKTRDMVFYPNPNVKETSKIHQGKLYDFLERNTKDKFKVFIRRYVI